MKILFSLPTLLLIWDFIFLALRAYVEVFSSKPPDWQSFVKFYVVPPVVATSGKGIFTRPISLANFAVNLDWSNPTQMEQCVLYTNAGKQLP
jgi:PACS-1 cytosolic sorting protein